MKKLMIAFGSKDALKDNAADIELARNSFKKPD